MAKKYTAIEREINAYRKNNVISEIKDKTVAAVVRMPVSVGTAVLDIDNIPSVMDLPKLPEHKRDFAIRSANSYKTNAEWGRIYGVHEGTISRWRSDPDVAAVIASIRADRRSFDFGMMLEIERYHHKRILELLTMKLTPSNADTLLAVLKFVHNEVLGHGVEETPVKEKAGFNVSIGITPGSTYGDYAQSESPFKRPERDVTESDLDALEHKLRRVTSVLDMLEESDAIDIGGNGDSEGTQ